MMNEDMMKNLANVHQVIKMKQEVERRMLEEIVKNNKKLDKLLGGKEENKLDEKLGSVSKTITNICSDYVNLGLLTTEEVDMYIIEPTIKSMDEFERNLIDSMVEAMDGMSELEEQVGRELAIQLFKAALKEQL